jgi:hypothetical protein
MKRVKIDKESYTTTFPFQTLFWHSVIRNEYLLVFVAWHFGSTIASFSPSEASSWSSNKAISFSLYLAGVSRRIFFGFAGDAEDLETGETRDSLDGFCSLKGRMWEPVSVAKGESRNEHVGGQDSVERKKMGWNMWDVRWGKSGVYR